MAFMCPKQDEIPSKQGALNAIVDVANELRKEFDNVYCEPIAATKCPCNCPGMQQQQQQQPETPCEPPNVMVCYKVGKVKGSAKTKKNVKKTNDGPPDVIRLKQSKSRELRAGVMYVGCDCEKRNGLQDDCQRTECHGSPECLTMPYPTCGPSEFSNGKHLGRPYPNIGSSTVSGGSYGGVSTGQYRPDNVEAADAVEYEYQCYPAVEKATNELDEMCPCNHNGNESIAEDSLSICEYCSDRNEWEYVAYPAGVTDIKQIDSCQCEYRCRVCDRSLPLCLH